MASRKALQGRGSRGATELGGGIAYTRFEEQDVESSQSSIGRPAGVGAARTGGGLAAGHGLTFVDDNEPEVVQVELPAEQFDNLPAVGAATGAAKGPWFDYVIVFDRDMLKSNKKQGLAHQQVFESIKQSLRKIKGIMLDEQESRFHTNPEHFLLVGGDEAFFQTYAEVLKIKKKLRHKIDGMEEMEFNRNHAHLFADPQEGQAFFNSRERIHMLQTLISQHPQRGGAGLSLGESREEGYVKEFFPLHDEQERVVLENRWIKSRDPFKFFQWLGYKKERVVYDAQGRAEKELYKPAFERLDMIRDYFGESIAMYFGFLEVYTLWLVFSALVGAGVFVAQATDRDDYLVVNPATGLTEVRAYNTYDGYVMPFYCIFLAISVSVFLEWWKRNQNMLAHRWEQTEQAEIERPEFKGHLTEGFWTKEEEWVSVPLRKEYTVIKKKYAKHFDWVYKAEFKDLGHRYHFLRKWYLVGYGAITTAVVIVLAAAMTLLALREWLYFNKGPQWASYIGGPSFAITIKVLDFVYYRVAKYITDREDHVWQSKYESSLISKVFLFQFVNNALHRLLLHRLCQELRPVDLRGEAAAVPARRGRRHGAPQLHVRAEQAARLRLRRPDLRRQLHRARPPLRQEPAPALARERQAQGHQGAHLRRRGPHSDRAPVEHARLRRPLRRLQRDDHPIRLRDAVRLGLPPRGRPRPAEQHRGAADGRSQVHAHPEAARGLGRQGHRPLVRHPRHHVQRRHRHKRAHPLLRLDLRRRGFHQARHPEPQVLEALHPRRCRARRLRHQVGPPRVHPRPRRRRPPRRGDEGEDAGVGGADEAPAPHRPRQGRHRRQAGGGAHQRRRAAHRALLPAPARGIRRRHRPRPGAGALLAAGGRLAHPRRAGGPLLDVSSYISNMITTPIYACPRKL